MKKIFFLLMAFATCFSMKAQDITGQWNGVLDIQGTQLRLVFNVTQNGDAYNTTLISLDQGATEIPVTKTTNENSKITFEVTNLNIEYIGELNDGKIIGIFKQGGLEIPMNLSRETIEKAAINRPQEPKEPYPYDVEEVSFQNSGAKITLAGTLTLPKNTSDFPVVILISGSGPQDRNEEMFEHKPFLVIADYLTRNGIGVLRYDDRGIGKSEGNFGTATSADFATDVESAMNYLKTRKDINPNKIGLIGHSEGGTIASIVAAETKDVNFIVSLAGPGISGYDILLLQTELVAKANGMETNTLTKELAFLKSNLDIVINGNDLEEIKTALTASIKKQIRARSEESPEGIGPEHVKPLVDAFTSPWYQFFLKFDPSTSFSKVKCSVLALNGAKDLQVPSKENFSAIKNALTKGGNKNVTIKEFPNLNHLFQEAETGSPTEYETIEQTFSPVVLEEITTWIKTQTE
jgi:dienelactone hydrolase